jgi:hypothetical protein
MRSVADAVKQLLDAQGATGPLSNTAARASASSVPQLHSKVMAPARILAPKTVGPAGLPPLMTAKQREALARASRGTITWLTRALDQQQVTEDITVQQACELLCALSDVVFVVLSVSPDAPGMTPQATSRSSSSRPQGYNASAFMRLDCAGGVVRQQGRAGHRSNASYAGAVG